MECAALSHSHKCVEAVQFQPVIVLYDSAVTLIDTIQRQLQHVINEELPCCKGSVALFRTEILSGLDVLVPA